MNDRHPSNLPRLGAWAAKRMLHYSGLLALARHARSRVRALVLRYHALTDGPSDVLYAAPGVCLPVEAFRLQMAFARRAYTVVPLDELVAAVARGGKLPPRALAITFDDGYADNHRLAFPVLQGLGFPATLYVTTGALDGGPPLWMSAVRALVRGAPGRELSVAGLPALALGTVTERDGAARILTRALVPLAPADRAERLARAAEAAGVDLERRLAGVMLTWAEVRELARAGWTIGAHTVTHLNVALASPAEAEAEIVASRDAIAAAVGAPALHFAYPNTGGVHRYFGPDTAALLRRLGFRSAVVSRAGALRPGADLFTLPRLGIGPRLAPVGELAAALERQRLAA